MFLGRFPSDKSRCCNQIACKKTVSYTLRVEKDVFARVRKEAGRRKKSLADIFRDSIAYGLPALPGVPDTDQAIPDKWEKPGPTPEIDYQQR